MIIKKIIIFQTILKIVFKTIVSIRQQISVRLIKKNNNNEILYIILYYIAMLNLQFSHQLSVNSCQLSLIVYNIAQSSVLSPQSSVLSPQSSVLSP